MKNFVLFDIHFAAREYDTVIYTLQLSCFLYGCPHTDYFYLCAASKKKINRKHPDVSVGFAQQNVI